MTAKRCLLAVGVLGTLSSFALLTHVHLSQGPGVTRANFDRIAEGMTQAEVEVIFGSAPGPNGFGIGNGGSNIQIESWQSRDGSTVDIRLVNGLVDCKTWIDSTENVVVRTGRWLLQVPPPPPQRQCILGTSTINASSPGVLIAR
jgi:hypothetical protein